MTSDRLTPSNCIPYSKTGIIVQLIIEMWGTLLNGKGVIINECKKN